MEANPHHKQAQYDDEISLVDLASTFLKRRRVFYVVFSLVLLAGIVYAVLAPEKYDYVSLIKLAEKRPGDFIESPAAIIATLENRWLPEYQAVYRAEHDRTLPFKITLSNPESTGLIRIVSEASPQEKGVVKQFHSQLIDQLKQTQSTALSSLKQTLEAQIESLTSTIDMLEGSKDSGAALATTVERRFSLQATLASLQSMDVLAVSRESAEKKGPARSLIVMLAGLFGLMAGIFLAFFAEFAGAVKSEMSEM